MTCVDDDRRGIRNYAVPIHYGNVRPFECPAVGQVGSEVDDLPTSARQAGLGKA